MSSDVAWRYTGTDGLYYTGVPMRDLTADEFAALPEHLQAAVASGVIYEQVKAAPVRAGRAPVTRPAVAESEAH